MFHKVRPSFPGKDSTTMLTLMHAVVCTSLIGSYLYAPDVPQAEEPNKDLGSVPRGATMVHTFTIVNPTDKAWHIVGTRTSCGCATPTLYTQELPPRGQTTLAVTVNTQRFSGQRVFHLYVLFDLPQDYELHVSVKVESRDDIVITPGQLAFGRVRRGTTAQASARIEYRGSANWRLLDAKSDNAYIQTKLTEIARGPFHAAYELHACVQPNLPVGTWYADVWLETNDTRTPRLRVPLVVEVEGDVTVVPSTLHLGRVSSTTVIERKVLLRGAQAFTITRVEGTDDSVAAEFDSAKKERHLLLVRIRPRKDWPDGKKTLRIFTDLPGCEPVTLTIQALVDGP